MSSLRLKRRTCLVSLNIKKQGAVDYKVNVINDKLEVSDALMSDFPDLLFGMISDGIAVFDATEYCDKDENATSFNSRVFMRAVKPFIEGFVKIKELDSAKLFYQLGPNGHSLINAQLVFLFLAFTNNTWLAYFNDIVSEAINNGVAYSDSFLLKQAAQRIPSEVLKMIIESREQEDEQFATTGN